MTAQELNKQAIEEFNNLEEHNYFLDLKTINQEIKDCKDRFSSQFYLEMQDKLTYLYGEINNSYTMLFAELERYLVIRKLQIILQITKNKGEFSVGEEKIKITTTLLNSALSSLIRAEVDELFKVILILEGKLKTITNSTQTTRSHLYFKETQKEQ